MSPGFACSTLFHAGVIGGLLLVWDDVSPPIVGTDIMSVEIVMESSDPGGGEGVQQQMVKQKKPVQEMPETFEEVVEDVAEEMNKEAEIVHDAPVSKLADVVLQRKPKSPVHQKQPVKKTASTSEPLDERKAQVQSALENLKGQAQGQTTQGTKQLAGIQQAGLSGEVKSAHYVLGSAQNPKPKYPKLARKRGWQGRVVLSVHINEEGRPVDIQIKQSSGYKILDRAALKALKKWTFQPAQKGGFRVASHLSIPIRFDLMNS